MNVVRQAIHTDQAPKAIGPYSQAVRVGDTVYMAGQIPLDPVTMQMVEGDFEKEATRVFENIKAVIAASGGTFRQVVKVTIFLTTFDNFAKVNELMAKYFRTLPGPLDGRGRRVAAQCSRRDRVHAAPGLIRFPGGNTRATGL